MPKRPNLTSIGSKGRWAEVGGGGITPHTLVVVGIPSAEAMGAVNVDQVASSTLAPTGIAASGTTGQPNAHTTDHLAGVGGLPSLEALGAPAVRSVEKLLATGLGSAEAVGSPALVRPDVLALSVGITTLEAVGQPALSGGAILTTTTTTTTTTPPPGLIDGVPATVTQVVDRLLQESSLRKKTRFTRLAVNYPIHADPPFFRLPYNAANGVPTISAEYPLRNIQSYSISESDNLAAAQVTVKAANTETGTFTLMLQQNELLRVEERYSNSQGWTTGWITVGHYLIDAVNPSAQGGEGSIDITGRDLFKLLTFPGFEQNLQADKIRVSRRQLRYRTTPKRDSTTYYVFVDGEQDAEGNWTQTFNWASPPVPRLYKDGLQKRITFQDGSIQVLYGTGEIIIDQEFFETKEVFGGLGMDPRKDVVEIEYSRYCQPEDEMLFTVELLNSDGVTVTMLPGTFVDADPGSQPLDVQSWQNNLTLVVESGAAKNQRYRIVGVNPYRHRVTLDRDPSLEGLAPGDTVRIGEGNRIEHVIERVLLAAGFQNVDPTGPFYTAIAKPNTRFTDPSKREFQLTLPSVDDFDFRNQNRAPFLDVYTKIQPLLPPFMQLYADEAMRIVYRAVVQAIQPQYEVGSDAASGAVESTDAEVFTRVEYLVRDRELRNLAFIGNKPRDVKQFFVYNPPLQPDPDTDQSRGPNLWQGVFDGANSYLEVWKDANEWNDAPPARVDGESEWQFFTQQCYYAICDGLAQTSITIENDHTGTSQSIAFDGLPIFHIEFVNSFRLKEIHLICYPWNQGTNTAEFQYWQIESSMDGIIWEFIGDEFNFDQNGRRVLTTSDFGEEVQCRYLRWSISKAATYRIDSGGLIHHATKFAFASMASVQVYADDVIQGFAELGVDRFDQQLTITAVGPGFIEVNQPVEERWLSLNTWVDPVGQIDSPIGFSGNRFLVSGDPTLAGVAVGGQVILEAGETAADFAADQERRRRLGRRTFTTATVDEVGYYIVQQRQKTDRSYSLLRYAEDKAKELLAEISMEFFPMTVTSIRPDMRLRDTCRVNLERLGFAGNALVREISRNSDGTLQFKATPFRDVAIRTYSETSTITTTQSETTTTSTSTSTTGTTTSTTVSSSSTTSATTTVVLRRVTVGGTALVS